MDSPEERYNKLMGKDKEYLVNMLIKTEDDGVNAFKAYAREKEVLRVLVSNGILKDNVIDCAREGLSMVDNGYLTIDQLMNRII